MIENIAYFVMGSLAYITFSWLFPERHIRVLDKFSAYRKIALSWFRSLPQKIKEWKPEPRD